MPRPSVTVQVELTGHDHPIVTVTTRFGGGDVATLQRLTPDERATFVRAIGYLETELNTVDRTD